MFVWELVKPTFRVNGKGRRVDGLVAYHDVSFLVD